MRHQAEKIEFELAKGFEAEHFDSYLQMANSQQQKGQDSPVMFGVAGSNPRNSMRRHRWDFVGRFWFFSHFSIAVSVIPSPSSFASCVMDSERSIRFLRRCSPRVVGVAG